MNCLSISTSILSYTKHCRCYVCILLMLDTKNEKIMWKNSDVFTGIMIHVLITKKYNMIALWQSGVIYTIASQWPSLYTNEFIVIKILWHTVLQCWKYDFFEKPLTCDDIIICSFSNYKRVILYLCTLYIWHVCHICNSLKAKL